MLSGEPVAIRYPGILDNKFNTIGQFLNRILGELDLSFLAEPVYVIVKELAANASRANAKRIFFKEEDAKFTELPEYNQAMRQFHKTVLEDWDNWRMSHSKNDHYVEIKTGLKDNMLRIQVSNNAALLPFESVRIKERLDSFRKGKDIENLLIDVMSDEEGAGIGLALIMTLLSNAGVPPANFKIGSDKNQTISAIGIPLSLTSPDIADEFRSIVISKLDSLPSFPDHIQRLWDMCNSPTTEISTVAQEIERDPALTAQILRLANSAGFKTRVRHTSVSGALKVVGLKSVGELLLVVGARNTLAKKFPSKELEKIWDDSNEISSLARRISKSKQVAEYAGLAGLLSELGRIVLLSVNPETIKKLGSLREENRIRNLAMIEEIALGISYAEIGALVAEKWQFPEPIIDALRYQQKPLKAPEENRELIWTLFSAIRLHRAQSKSLDPYSVEHDVLKFLNLESPEEFNSLVHRLADQVA